MKDSRALEVRRDNKMIWRNLTIMNLNGKKDDLIKNSKTNWKCLTNLNCKININIIKGII